MLGHLKTGWLVLVLALVFGAALAGVQVAWGPIIERNKVQAAKRQIPVLLLGPMDAGQAAEALAAMQVESHEFRIPQPGGGEKYYTAYQARSADGELLGFVVQGAGRGYADVIELLVGLDPSLESITGMSVLANNETPGLGNKIADDDWEAQFRGKDLWSPVKVAKKGEVDAPEEVQAVTGATISSEAVAEIVNRIIRDTHGRLKNLRGPTDQAEE